MIKSFYIMHKNERVCKVEIKDSKPIVIKYKTNKAYQEFATDTPTMQEVLDWLEDRCVPRYRFNIDEILLSMKLDTYNVMDIISHTHGLLYEDYTWILWEGENIDYENIRIR